jgi:hypothetical protein
MVGREKYLFIINFNKSNYNDEAEHCSTNLVLGSFSTILQLLFFISLFAQGRIKGWDKREYAIGYSFFTMILLLQMGPTNLLL